MYTYEKEIKFGSGFYFFAHPLNEGSQETQRFIMEVLLLPVHPPPPLRRRFHLLHYPITYWYVLLLIPFLSNYFAEIIFSVFGLFCFFFFLKIIFFFHGHVLSEL